MAICPKCSSEKCVKDGIVKERQRYQCIPNISSKKLLLDMDYC